MPGKLFADPAVARYEDAKKCLALAAPHPQSYSLMAKILAEQDNQLGAAIQQLRRYIALTPEPGYWHDVYVSHVLQLADQKPPTSQHLLEEAEIVALRLTKNGRTQRNRMRGEELLQQVEAKLKGSVACPPSPQG